MNNVTPTRRGERLERWMLDIAGGGPVRLRQWKRGGVPWALQRVHDATNACILSAGWQPLSLEESARWLRSLNLSWKRWRMLVEAKRPCRSCASLRRTNACSRGATEP